MKYSVYAMHDNVIGWGSPHIAINDEAEMRDFRNAMANDPNAADKQLYKVGQWDSETGELVGAKYNEKLLEGKPHGTEV